MSDRADRLSEAVGQQELEALLLTTGPNLRWVTGFTGTNAVALVGRDVRLFFTDFRYIEQASEQVHGFDHVQAGRDLLAEVARRLTGRVGFEDAALSVRSYNRLSQALNGSAELVGASGAVERLREVKDGGELAAMRAAAGFADRAYEELAERGIDGRTEKQIATDLEVRMRELGADGVAFPPIVASGSHGALPHAVPRDVAIERDTFMIVDIGAIVEDYRSDCTRTFAVGSPDDAAIAVYELVAEAQRAGLAAVTAGADCKAVDSAARELIEAGGHGDHFGHGLGHGVGLEIHEAPRLAQSAEGALRAGNTVTVEPGVYVPGVLGVRIEDLVAVTRSGCEILSGFTKSLVSLT